MMPPRLDPLLMTPSARARFFSNQELNQITPIERQNNYSEAGNLTRIIDSTGTNRTTYSLC